MIPVFPKFKKLEIVDKEELKKYVEQHPPYSDYNFVSLWSWDTENKAELSFLNDNLVLKYQDYITSEKFYSFLGTQDLHTTIETLHKQAQKESLAPRLRLIPENVVNHLTKPHSQFTIEEDRDNFDYILSTEDLIGLKGNRFRAKRNFLNRFQKFYGNKTTVRLLSVQDLGVQKEIEQLFFLWEEKSGRKRKDTENELKAITKLFQGIKNLENIQGVGIEIAGKLAGFSINEVVHHKHGVIHFEKADVSFVGIFTFLKQQSAVEFKKIGCTFINYEQDLGIEGLRKAKLAYHPTHFLKKYTISAK